MWSTHVVLTKSENDDYKYSDLKARVIWLWTIEEVRPYYLFVISQWFSVILDDSWWFANHSEMILGNFLWFLVIYKKKIWNDCRVILSDLQTTLKWFLGDSWWFANHSEMNPVWFTPFCPFISKIWSLFRLGTIFVGPAYVKQVKTRLQNVFVHHDVPET